MTDLSPIARMVTDGLSAAPCAVVAAAIRREKGWHFGIGAAGRLWAADDAPLATLSTPFDLASLTKPVTALCLARLEARGVLARSERLGSVLPALASTPSAALPLDLFAAHRAGLDGHRPLYAPLVTGEPVDVAASLVTAAEARREECSGDAPFEGFSPVYSDLGYLLLGAAIAARTGGELDAMMEREVTGPLGIAIGSARALRALRPSFDDEVAPTEDVAWRGGVIRGAVHDENAWALSRDAASGHAGLFGDALSVARLGVAILEALGGERPAWLSAEAMHALVRPRPGGSHRAGFDSRSGDAPTSGARFGPATFGHLGFTGTSLWMDPDAALVGVLLTNRVHPTRASIAIRAARPAVYDALYEAMRAPGAGAW